MSVVWNPELENKNLRLTYQLTTAVQLADTYAYVVKTKPSSRSLDNDSHGVLMKYIIIF